MTRRPTREEACMEAAMHAVEGLARQDARAPYDAARHALGPDATDEQLTEWVRKYRPEGLRSTA